MKKDFRTLRNNMRLLRITRGISQEDLAMEIHIARSTYSTYETGGKIPDLQTIDALSYLYDISFDSLVNHDLSKGLLQQVYLNLADDGELARILNDYQSLSIASKNIILEKIDTLLERESIFYGEYTRSAEKK